MVERNMAMANARHLLGTRRHTLGCGEPAVPACNSAHTFSLPEDAPDDEIAQRKAKYAESIGYRQVPQRAVRIEATPESMPYVTRAVSSLVDGPNAPARHVRTITTSTAVYLLSAELIELRLLAPAFCALVEARGWPMTEIDTPGRGSWCCGWRCVGICIERAATVEAAVKGATT
jgi:hypothetical protein